jgi:hypothetical protein
MSSETRRNIINKIGLPRKYWIRHVIFGFLTFVGAILLVINAILKEKIIGLLVAGAVLVGKGGFGSLICGFMTWFYLVYTRKHRQDLEQHIHQRENIVTEFTYTYDSDFKDFVKSENGLTRPKLLIVLAIVLPIVLVGTLLWGKIPFKTHA